MSDLNRTLEEIFEQSRQRELNPCQDCPGKTWICQNIVGCEKYGDYHEQLERNYEQKQSAKI